MRTRRLKINLVSKSVGLISKCVGVAPRLSLFYSAGVESQAKIVSVRDKIRRDEEANKGKDSEQNMSSGGSYYEACGDDGKENIENYYKNNLNIFCRQKTFLGT